MLRLKFKLILRYRDNFPILFSKNRGNTLELEEKSDQLCLKARNDDFTGSIKHKFYLLLCYFEILFVKVQILYQTMFRKRILAWLPWEQYPLKQDTVQSATVFPTKRTSLFQVLHWKAMRCQFFVATRRRQMPSSHHRLVDLHKREHSAFSQAYF